MPPVGHVPWPALSSATHPHSYELPSADLHLRIHTYLREDMGYDWLTLHPRFAYDYSL